MTEEAIPAAAPKVDPETLAIRSRPAKAIRFKRGAIVAIVALGSVSISTVAWMALRPHGLHHVIQPDDGTQPAGKVGSDALNGLPSSYGEVPKLGPPLPGDLGKPILEHQQSTLMADSGDAQRTDANAAAERVLAEAKSARESAILVHGGSTDAAAAAPTVANAEASPATTEARKLALDPAADPNGQQGKADFVAAQDKGGDTNPYRLAGRPLAFP